MTAARTSLQSVISQLSTALETGNVDAAVELFAPECYWRDLVTFTWNIVTMEGPDQVRDMLEECLAATAPTGLVVSDREEVTEADGVIEGWIEFETGVARGYGLVRVKDGKIWTLLTTMAELKGHEEPTDATRPRGAKHGSNPGELTWLESREHEAATLGYENQPYVVIVGGGQGAIALGARLRQLKVPTIIVEKNERPGDSWRKRYKSLCLHDPVWYDHLPYLDFPKNWPVFSPKDKLGDWLEMYTRVMELNYWTSSEVTGASWDDAAQEWVVNVNRAGEALTLRPKHMVFATGMSGKANIPNFPGSELFAGEQHHSSKHPGADQYAGKRVVVVGSNNSAHDICAALFEAGSDVTMVQRSTTHIVRSESLMEYGLGDLYSERAVASGITTGKADLIFASLPYAILHDFQKPVYDKIREVDADFYASLAAAGFELDYGVDETGLFMKYLRRGSGYYIDVGASQLVIDGSIKLAHGQIERLTETSVVLADGTEIEADLVVYATGYGSMNGWVTDLIDQETADRLGKCWGLGSDTPKDPGPWEGELRNMWKPTQVQSLWMHGGNLHQSRHYSQFLALQLKARYEKIDTPVYRLQPSYHPS